MQLLVNGLVLPISQMGPDFLLIDAPIKLEPATATIVMQVDASERRWNVYLPGGMSAENERVGAHTVQVKVRYYGDFTTLTRQISVEEPLTEAAEIYRLGCFLPGREKLVSRPLRLLGLGVSSLREPQGQQLALL